MPETTVATPPTTRSVTREIEIEAPVETVWKALTDAEELVRWFPLEARVTPGLGGSVWMRWDDTEYDAGRITAWEVGKHLRTEDVGGTWAGVATDYHLRPSASGRGTVLRVVSSGFGDSDAWSDTLESFGLGWDFELRGLRHYLTRHHGTRRASIRACTSYTSTHADAWRRIVGPNGWLGVAPSASLSAGTRFEARTATGHDLSGIVEHVSAPRQLVVALEQWNRAFFRVHLYRGKLWIWASTYGVPDAEIAAVEREWQRSLETVL